MLNTSFSNKTQLKIKNILPDEQWRVIPSREKQRRVAFLPPVFQNSGVNEQ